ncbi:MAG: VanZ family protein [Planctomycetota bacterium]
MYWLWLGYWVLLFIVMHLRKPPGAGLALRLGDKMIHCWVYFILALLGGWAAHRQGRRLGIRWAVRWWLIYAVYAGIDELLQPLVGRRCQFTDWLADALGVTLALLVSTGLARLRSSHR